MAIYVNDGGTLRTIRFLAVNDGGTIRRVHHVYVNDGGSLEGPFDAVHSTLHEAQTQTICVFGTQETSFILLVLFETNKNTSTVFLTVCLPTQYLTQVSSQPLPTIQLEVQLLLLIQQLTSPLQLRTKQQKVRLLYLIQLQTLRPQPRITRRYTTTVFDSTTTYTTTTTFDTTKSTTTVFNTTTTYTSRPLLLIPQGQLQPYLTQQTLPPPPLYRLVKQQLQFMILQPHLILRMIQQSIQLDRQVLRMNFTKYKYLF